MRLPALLASTAVLLAPGTAAAAKPTPEAIAAACSSTPPGATYAPNEVDDLRAFAACAVRELRDRPTPQDARLAPAAKAGVVLAAQGRSGARVKAAVLSAYGKRCDGRAAVRVVTGGTGAGGKARTPLAVASLLRSAAGTTGAAPLLGRRTRVAVATRRSGDVITLLVAGGTCTARG